MTHSTLLTLLLTTPSPRLSSPWPNVSSLTSNRSHASSKTSGHSPSTPRRHTRLGTPPPGTPPPRSASTSLTGASITSKPGRCPGAPAPRRPTLPPPRPLPQYHRYPLRPCPPLASPLRRPRARKPLPIPVGAASWRRCRRRHTPLWPSVPPGGWPNILKAALWTCWPATTTSAGRPRLYVTSARPSPRAWRRTAPRPKSSRSWSGCSKPLSAMAAIARRWWWGVTAFTCPCVRGRLTRKGRRRR